MRLKGDGASYDSSGSLNDISLGCYSDNEPDYVPDQSTQHSPALPEEEQHHISSTSPLKYMQVSVGTMRALTQETELRLNTKTHGTAEIKNDSRHLMKMGAKLSKDKEERQLDKTKISICFDLQEVLMAPHSSESVLYYKRKLNTYNLSRFDLGSGQAIATFDMK